ncbi:hypothetical protein DFQ27_000994 [Actinomortierella ambigua]|uniref:DNA polymerase epsilon subunit D n=1 Tax=Actinomortierella ambigua TaxID=1343610 RepID=A0A9P6QLY8_9FUNG|nr:hypothetical protein DFQ27_000994 [Actinomortierella ambigua]
MSSSIEDNELPKAILTRIMKRALPDNTNIQSNAKLAISKSTTIFINYLAATANEAAHAVNHKIINASHVFKALEMLDLEEMIPELTAQLEAYQKLQKSKKISKESAKEGESASKKRKPTGSSKGKSKALKGGSSETPGQKATDGDVDMEGGDDDDEDDEDEEEEEEEEEEEDGQVDAQAEASGEDDKETSSHSQGNQTAALNMQDKDDEDHLSGPSDEEGEDSDGF